uniref:Uncharacterized protein n=1 Tax=Hyaloperonospora arabidopsidis (strain Emoy2) TaxID=559515 RepID=M4BDH0_HYAAE
MVSSRLQLQLQPLGTYWVHMVTGEDECEETCVREGDQAMQCYVKYPARATPCEWEECQWESHRLGGYDRCRRRRRRRK